MSGWVECHLGLGTQRQNGIGKGLKASLRLRSDEVLADATDAPPVSLQASIVCLVQNRPNGLNVAMLRHGLGRARRFCPNVRGKASDKANKCQGAFAG
ncbi:MAG: hypothetical protein Rhob2KO_29130 [Rhodopirellula baltica]